MRCFDLKRAVAAEVLVMLSIRGSVMAFFHAAAGHHRQYLHAFNPRYLVGAFFRIAVCIEFLAS